MGLDVLEAVRLQIYLLDLKASLAQFFPAAVGEVETHVDIIAFGGILQLDHIFKIDLNLCLDFLGLFNYQFSPLLMETIFVDVVRLYAYNLTRIEVKNNGSDVLSSIE